MPTISFSGLLLVAAVAFGAPLLLGLSPARRLPSVVLEIVVGILIGPAVLGWARVDLPIPILSLLGLAFLLFLAGLEVELERLKGRLLIFVSGGFLLSFGLALLIGFMLFLWLFSSLHQLCDSRHRVARSLFGRKMIVSKQRAGKRVKDYDLWITLISSFEYRVRRVNPLACQIQLRLE